MFLDADHKADLEQQQLALEQAAKYICSLQWGKCPMAVNKFPCPEVCGADTRPWKCWISYFLHLSQNTSDGAGNPASGF